MHYGLFPFYRKFIDFPRFSTFCKYQLFRQWTPPRTLSLLVVVIKCFHPHWRPSLNNVIRQSQFQFLLLQIIDKFQSYFVRLKSFHLSYFHTQKDVKYFWLQSPLVLCTCLPRPKRHAPISIPKRRLVLSIPHHREMPPVHDRTCYLLWAWLVFSHNSGEWMFRSWHVRSLLQHLHEGGQTEHYILLHFNLPHLYPKIMGIPTLKISPSQPCLRATGYSDGTALLGCRNAVHFALMSSRVLIGFIFVGYMFLRSTQICFTLNFSLWTIYYNKPLTPTLFEHASHCQCIVHVHIFAQASCLVH